MAEHADPTTLISLENGARQARAARRGASLRRVVATPSDEDTEERRSEGGACPTGGEAEPHQRARASAGDRGASRRRGRTPRRGWGTERVDEAQGASARRADEAQEAEDAEGSSVAGGAVSAECADAAARVSLNNAARRAHEVRRRASMRCVDETPDDADSEDRRNESDACSSVMAGGLHRRARTNAGTRGSSGRRVSTPRRERVTEQVGNVQGKSARRVDEAPEAEDAEDSSVEGRADPTRTSAGTRGSSGRRARTPRRGRVTERRGNVQGVSARRVDKAPEAADAEDSCEQASGYAATAQGESAASIGVAKVRGSGTRAKGPGQDARGCAIGP